MKIVIASDSFKGSLSSVEVGETIKEAVKSVDENIEVVVSPLADGGEGTADAVLACHGGNDIECEVLNARGEKIEAHYALTNNGIAVIDSASAVGLSMIKEDERNPMEYSSFGVGQMIDNAIRRGCRNFIIGIGGTATNDGGVGMLEALGVKFFNRFGNRIKDVKAKDLSEIKHIDFSEGNRHIPECRFRIACDVENVLCGANGCSVVYGPQKGLSEENIDFLDNALYSLADTVKISFKKDTKSVQGVGAGGGLAWAFYTFLGGKLEKGLDIIADVTNLEDKLEGADLFITGEGRIDGQSVMGKAPVGAAKIAKAKGIKVIAFCGSVGEGAEKVNAEGIDAYFPILQFPCIEEDAMNRENAKTNLYKTSVQFFNTLLIR